MMIMTERLGVDRYVRHGIGWWFLGDWGECIVHEYPLRLVNNT